MYTANAEKSVHLQGENQSNPQKIMVNQKSVHLKIDAELWAEIADVKNRNRWINEAIRMKLDYEARLQIILDGI